jgi:hypothetical protein
MANAPSAQTGTYPIADEVMQLARAMVNDMLRDAAGRILTNTAPFALVYLNSAIRRVQRYFANNGLENFIKDNVILAGIKPVATTDPGVQVTISSTGYFDGINMNAQPVLPADLICPLRVSERQTGSGASYSPMNPVRGDGLASRVPGQTFDDWEWRNDNLNLNGSINTMDLKLRYEASIPPIGTGANLAQVAIPLRDAHEALATWVVWYYAFARGSMLLSKVEQVAKEAMDEVVGRFVRKDNRIAYRPKGFRSGGGPIDGALTGSYK